MVRVVIDTNVIISGIIRPGPSRKIWHAFKTGLINAVISPAIFEELARTLSRSKFKNLISENERKEVVMFIQALAESVTPSQIVSICRDPEDNHMLTTAATAKVDFIITGDKDLLILNPYHNIQIIPPAKFLKILGK